MKTILMILIIMNAVTLSSCQTSTRLHPNSSYYVENTKRVPTPHLQKEENRQEKLKRGMNIFTAKFLEAMLDDYPKMENESNSYHQNKSFYEKEKGQSPLGLLWREAVERPTKKAYRKAFD